MPDAISPLSPINSTIIFMKPDMLNKSIRGFRMAVIKAMKKWQTYLVFVAVLCDHIISHAHG